MKEAEPIQLWLAHNGNASLSPAFEALRREVEDELNVPRRQARELLQQLMGGRPDAAHPRLGKTGGS